VTASRLVCAACGAQPAPREPYPFRCPNAGRGDDLDHVLRRELTALSFPADSGEENPFLRFRTLLHAWHAGLEDGEFVALVRRLDDAVARVDGHGFRITPFARNATLSDELGFSSAGGVWVKDETGNVSGSHKARHLFGVLVWLETAERLGLTGGERRDLAIASCGNAALAAAVVAAAGGRRLRVFVPVDAEPAVLERLETLRAEITVCTRRPGARGDPTVHALMRSLDEGALPFTVQGHLNALAIEGGHTLAWEIAAARVSLDRLVVQVGGGALASACVAGLREALPKLPRIDTVQTEGAWPLRRAYDAVVARGGLAYAIRHRHEFMRPWEQEPHSVAHGILDDETYDWAAVVDGMLATGGEPLVVGERTLRQACELGRETTGIRADATGTAGLAGLLAQRESGHVGDDERVAVLFTGVDRKEASDAELSRAGHPLAEAVRAV
jgi:threonine synthase